MPLSWIARGAASAERGRRLMELRGVTPNGHPLWQRWEVDPVIGLYPAYRSIFPLLDRRTKPAVYGKAGRLGITKPYGQPWDDNGILRLRIYRTGTKEEILAAFPGRTWDAIARAARKRGHFRPKQQTEPSGILIVDQILERARAMHMPLSALDAVGRRKGYFTRRKWRKCPDFRVYLTVVEALGGNIRVRFDRPSP